MVAMNDIRRGLVGTIVSPNARIIEAFRLLYKAAEVQSSRYGGTLADIDYMKVTPITTHDPRLPSGHTVSMSFSMSVPEAPFVGESHIERGSE